MLLLSELSLVRFEGVSEERKAGWRGDWVCMCVFDCVYICAAEGMVKGRDREAGRVCEETTEVV